MGGDRSHPKAVKGTPKESPTATKGRPETPKSAQRESKRRQCKTTDTQKAATGTPEGKPRESHMREPPRLRIKRRRPEMAPKDSPQDSQGHEPPRLRTKKDGQKGRPQRAHQSPKRDRGRPTAPKGTPKESKGPPQRDPRGTRHEKVDESIVFSSTRFQKNRFRARMATIQGKQPQKHTPRKQTKTLKKTHRNIRVLQSKVSRSGLGLTFWTCDTHDGCIFTRKKPRTKPKQRII